MYSTPISISRSIHSSRQQVVDVRLAQAGADAGEDACASRQFCDALHRLARARPSRPRRSSLTISVPSTLISGVTLPSCRSRLARFVGDEVAVGEDLEVAVRVLGEHVEQLRVHERLAADDAEEDVAHLLRFADQLVERVGLDRLLLGGHIDPAALAAQVAAVDDRDVEKRRKELRRVAAGACACWTDSMPLKPMFQASFQSSRLSVSKSTRLASLSDASIVTAKPRCALQKS